MGFVITLSFVLMVNNFLYSDATALEEKVFDEIKSLRKAVEMLENTVQKQNDQIMKLQEKDQNQQRLIDRLMWKQSTNNWYKPPSKYNLKSDSSKGALKKFSFRNISRRDIINSNSNKNDNSVNDNRLRKKRSSTTIKGDYVVAVNFPHRHYNHDNHDNYNDVGRFVAFHAQRSKDLVPRAGETIKFDAVDTNVGKGYNGRTGIFTVPRTGIYVFCWIIRMHSAEHSTELMINKNVKGKTFLRAKNGDDGSVSGTVVAHVSKGDTVYIRNHSSLAGDGRIYSNLHGRPTFSGWIIH